MSTPELAFPYAIGADGRTRTSATEREHVRDMIELVLFTNPGERVMRPDFGAGLSRYVFGPNSPQVAATLQASVQAALTQALGDVIDLQDVAVTSVDSTLAVRVSYAMRSTGQPDDVTFPRSQT
jgi:phage baseplate assembly protein W